MFAAINKGAARTIKPLEKKEAAGHEGGAASGRWRTAAARQRRGYEDEDLVQRGDKAPTRLSSNYIGGRIDRVVGKTVREALATEIRTIDGIERRYGRRELHSDLHSGYIRLEHPAEDCKADTPDCKADTPDCTLLAGCVANPQLLLLGASSPMGPIPTTQAVPDTTGRAICRSVRTYNAPHAAYNMKPTVVAQDLVISSRCRSTWHIRPFRCIETP